MAVQADTRIVRILRVGPADNEDLRGPFRGDPTELRGSEHGRRLVLGPSADGARSRRCPFPTRPRGKTRLAARVFQAELGGWPHLGADRGVIFLKWDRRVRTHAKRGPAWVGGRTQGPRRPPPGAQTR
jgi:hypothetical protein